MAKPSIGRTVHFSSKQPNVKHPLAAIITNVKDNTTVDLFVFDKTEGHYHEDIKLDESLSPGSWAWPKLS